MAEQGTAGIGHNEFTNAVRSYVERIERLNGEVDEINGAKKEVYQEAKSTGLDVKVLKKVIQRRRQDTSARKEQDDLVDVYERALGMG